MKLCPLITQASILDDKELLVHEIDEPELETASGAQAKEGDDIFMNPSAKPPAKDSLADDLGLAREARFIAKSYRGQIDCLGDLCRFHDDAANACRFERMLDGGGMADAVSRIAEVREELGKAWESQRTSAAELTALVRELQEKASSRAAEERAGLESKLGELSAMIASTKEEARGALEGISRTLETKTSEIDGKVNAGTESFKLFQGEVADWKAILQKNVDAIGAEVERGKKMVDELSQNHSGIVKLVEHQKKNLAEEEKRRQLAEAKRLNNAGVMAYHNGQYEKGLELFKKAIELDPSFTEAYNNLGLTYTETNQEERATEAFRKAIELSPEMSAAYNNLGYVFYRLGSYEEAIEMYNEAIGRSKDSSSAYTNLGNAYYKLDRIDEAVAAWKRALEIDPGNEKARRSLKRFHAEVK